MGGWADGRMSGRADRSTRSPLPCDPASPRLVKLVGMRSTLNLRSLRALALAPLLGALACSSSTGPNGTVTARATALGISATNRTDRPIFYVAVEQGALALYDFIPCTDATRCPTIPSGGAGLVPWSDVVAYDASRHTYVFMWWQGPATTPGSQPRSGSIVVTR